MNQSIDINKVIQKMALQITDLTVRNTVLEAQVELLVEQLESVTKNVDQAVPTAAPKYEMAGEASNTDNSTD